MCIRDRKTETFSLSTESQMPNYLGIEAVLMDADEATSYAYAKEAYTIPKRRQDDWHLVMWAGFTRNRSTLSTTCWHMQGSPRGSRPPTSLGGK